MSTHFGQRYTVCKAYLSPNRIMFSAGHFRELDQMPKDFENLPLADLGSTVDNMLRIMRWNMQDPASPPLQPDHFFSAASLGVIQFREGHVEAKLGALGTDYAQVAYRDIDPAKFGVPRGLGTQQVIDRTHEVEANPTLAAQIAEHPKEELLRLLKSEAAEPNTNVGGPFTVLLMDNNGVVTDHSDNLVCLVP